MHSGDLAHAIGGAVLGPEDDGYDEARRIWNARLDSRPTLIVRCSGAPDVVTAVNLAREQDLLLSVKGGGHSYAGNATCDDGLMIDLSLMKEVRIDPDAMTARVEPGVTWGLFDHEAQGYGLATTGGTVSTVGVAGLALGGGSGWLARKHGLTIDNLVAADVVTADGRLVRASENEHPDLFWGLRGGGGNFGVVTAFEFRLHETGPTVLGGQILHPLKAAREVLQHYREFMADAPDETTCYPFMLRVPPVDAFPEQYHGEVAVDLVVAHQGTPADGEEILRSLREFGEPFLDTVGPLPYTTLQKSFDEGLPKGQRYYTRGHYLDGLSDQAIDTFVSQSEALAGPFTVAYLERLGGQIGRVDPASTALPHRDAPYGFHLLAGWTDPAEDEELMGWARRFHQALSPHSTGGVYVNLLAEDEVERVKAAYGDNYDRLVELKNEWDPENLFRMNHNIEP